MSAATKSAPKGHGRFKSYADLQKHTDKPLARRPELAIGRGGNKVVPRKFHLSDEEIAALKEEYKATKRFPNPHNKGFYFFLVEALVEMGIDEEHPLGRVQQKVKTLMSDEDTIEGEGKEKTTAWERFANKDPRNADTGKDWEARFDQNITVLQRLTGLTPYGLKLLNVGQKVMGREGGVIDVLVHETGTVYLRLNTKSDRPINQRKTRGMGSPAAIEAERKAARAATRKKNGKSKRKAKATAPTAPATDASSDATVAAS